MNRAETFDPVCAKHTFFGLSRRGSNFGKRDMPKTKKAKSTPAERFASLVGISRPEVRQLIRKGVLTCGASVTQWHREYLDHLRKVAASRLPQSRPIDRATAMAHQRAVQKSIELAVLRGELLPVAAVVEALTFVHSAVRSRLLSLPTRIRSLNPKQVKSLEAAVRGILKDLSKKKFPGSEVL